MGKISQIYAGQGPGGAREGGPVAPPQPCIPQYGHAAQTGLCWRSRGFATHLHPVVPLSRGGTSQCELTRSVWGWSFWLCSRQKSGLFSAFFPCLGFYQALLLVPPVVLCWVSYLFLAASVPFVLWHLTITPFPSSPPPASCLISLFSPSACVCAFFFFKKKIPLKAFPFVFADHLQQRPRML